VKKTRKGTARCSVRDVCSVLESLAPTALAQSWDNVGLLAGDYEQPVRRLLLCIDLTEAVADDAAGAGVDFILAYHPPIFKPISSLRRPSAGPEATVLRCLREGTAIYATHTALDAAEGGTNDVLAELCGVTQAESLEYVDQPGKSECKVVVFVPHEQVERVAGAMFDVGAGRIGDYRHCSYRLSGQGTFLGGESTNPTVGQRGRLETVEEIRLETVVRSRDLPAVVTALRTAHPYEEPAFDIYPLKPEPVRGIGRIGRFSRPPTLAALARKLKKATRATNVRLVGPTNRKLERAIVVAGSAGSLPFRLPLAAGDVIVTGELRHHDALTIRRLDCTAIALGHWTSERPVLAHLANRLREKLPEVDVKVSQSDDEPLATI